ncbi:MAG: helix-turn-helix transcriptional regulator [Treponema sp.]|nr:helix-turn-helix transcriptional regulator [Treponema sp.]MBQ2463706.1 helix-turn-helix transcriptional regulator [Treponema sp.]
MVPYKIEEAFELPVIDVAETSKNLKKLRVQHGISVAEIQRLLGMENPQSIYTWENSDCKYLPRLDNLVTLAKLYKVSLDDLIVIKTEKADALSVGQPCVFSGLSSEDMSFLQENASREVSLALENYYALGA